jgi:predicted acetyltransferase
MMLRKNTNELLAKEPLFQEYSLINFSRFSEASSNSINERWSELFKTSCRYSSETAKFLSNFYEGIDINDLTPSYLTDEKAQWAFLASPRVNSRTKQKFCYLNHWYALNADSFMEMINTIKSCWRLPYDAIKLCESIGHGVPSLAATYPGSNLQEFAFAADWQRNPPSSKFHNNEFFCDKPTNLDDWWPEFSCLLREGTGFNSDVNLTIQEMQTEMEEITNIENGGVVNLRDSKGLVGHISWELLSYNDLLIDKCWHVNYIVVRSDSRNKGIAKYLYSLMAKEISFSETPIVCALVKGENEASIKCLESSNAEKIAAYFSFCNSMLCPDK